MASPALAAPTYGIARSIDGDSLRVGNTEIRLFGIDAPEWDQTCQRAGKAWACGQAAAEQLSKLVTGKDVRCVAVDKDDHGRTVARCTVGGMDVNRTMVALGYAVAFRRYSSDYVSAEASAKANKRGIWAGTFSMPQAYRDAGIEPVRRSNRERAMPRVESVTRSSGSGCVIKGNRGTNGWIYHVPGMPYYAQTRAEETFCSEAAAQAAGYRRAKVR